MSTLGITLGVLTIREGQEDAAFTYGSQSLNGELYEVVREI